MSEKNIVNFGASERALFYKKTPRELEVDKVNELCGLPENWKSWKPGDEPNLEPENPSFF